MSMRSYLPRFTTARVLVLLVVLTGLGAGSYFEGRYLWAQYHLREGQKELDRQHYSKARAHFDLGLSVCPNDVDARVSAARACRMVYDYDQARKHLDACRNLSDPGGRVKLARDLLLAQQGDDFLAYEPQFNERLDKADPDSEAILEVMIRGNLKNNRTKTAIDLADKLLDIRPNHLSALLWKGEALTTAHDSNAAIDYFRQAIEQDPDNELAHGYLAYALYSINNPEEALAEYEILLKANPDDIEVRYEISRCYRKIGNKSKQAITLLDELIRLRPRENAFVGDRALAQYQLEPDSKESEDWLRRAHALLPTDRQVLEAFYHCLRERTVDQDLAAIASASVSAGVICHIGYAAQTELNGVEADMAHMEESANRYHTLTRQIPKTPPTSPDALKLRYEAARLALNLGYDEEMQKWTRQLLMHDKDDVQVHLILAEYYANHGNIIMYRYHSKKINELSAGGKRGR